MAVEPLVVVALVVALIWAAVAFSDRSPAAVDARSGSVWLSGEQQGRIVLAPPGGERPSVAVQVADDAAPLDVVEAGQRVLAQVRTTGEIIGVDASTGEVLGTVGGPTGGPVPVDRRPTLVAAGDVVFVLDATERTVRTIEADGTLGPARTVTDGFTDWAPTSDGLLWLVDDASGQLTRVGEDAADGRSLAEPGSDLEITAAGREAVVVDRTSMRLRWVRQDTSIDLRATVGGADAQVLVQGPDARAECVTVLSPTAMACVSRDGIERSTAVQRPITLAPGSMLFADDEQAVVATPGATEVTVIGWDGTVTTAERPDPSPRPLVGGASGSSLVIDDPGSTHAFSVVHGDVVPLDKFSRRTVVINGSAESAEGLGNEDAEAQVASVLPSVGDTEAAADDGENDPPTAMPDRAVTRVGRSVAIAVLSNDTDPEGDPLSIVDAGPLSPDDGVVKVVRGTQLSYTPPAESIDRSVSFRYTAADTSNLDDTATVTVEVIGSGRNTPPVTAADEATTTVNRNVDVSVTSNDADAEGDPLAVVSVTSGAHGTSAIAGDGSVRYEPAPGFEGDDTFTYTVVDGYGGSATGRVRITVEAPASVNRAPVALDDRAATSAGLKVVIEPLLNDSDPDGDPLRVLGVVPQSGITATVVSQRYIEVTPAATVGGLVTFDYTIADPGDLQATARVALFVQREQTADPPIALDDQATSAGTAVAIEVTANDVDPNGGQLVVDSWSQPTGGTGNTLRVSPTAVLFTPAPRFIGTTRFDYAVKNVAGGTDTASVTVTVTRGSGSAPVARPDSVIVFPGDVARIDALANDSHPDELPFGYAGQPTTRAGQATIGPDGWITFVPPDAELTTYVINYRIQDINGLQSRADISVTVVPRPTTNSAPSANPDTQTTRFDSSVIVDVLANDSDPDDDPLTVVGVGTPTSGSASVVGNAVRYSPPPGGNVTIAAMSYTVRDPDGLTASSQITILITPPVKVPPIAVDDLVTLTTGGSAIVPVLANDLDPDGSTAALVVSSVGAPSPNGIGVQQIGRSIRVSAGASIGTFVVPYTVADGDDLTGSGSLTVVVQTPPNTPPVTTDDAFSVTGQTTNLSVLDNDTDDGGELTLIGVTAVTPAAAGSAAVNGNRVAFAPAPSYSGTATFGYTVRDSQGATASANVVVTITACPTVPTLAALNTSTKYRTPVIVQLFGGALPPTGTVVRVGSPSPSGTATLSASSASVEYDPGSSTNGVVMIPWSVQTSCGDVQGSTIRVVVNQAPLAVSDLGYSTTVDQAITIPVLLNDRDPDGDPLSIDSVSSFVNGTASISGRQITFTPAVVGDAGFTYTISDPAGSSSTASVVIDVVEPNRPPVTEDGTELLTVPGSITIDVVLQYVTDPDGDPVRLIRASSSAGATTNATATASVVKGTLVFSASTADTYTVTYVVTDGTVQSTGRLRIVASSPVTTTTPPPTTTEPPTTTDPPVTTEPPTTTDPPVTTDPPTTTDPPPSASTTQTDPPATTTP